MNGRLSIWDRLARLRKRPGKAYADTSKNVNASSTPSSVSVSSHAPVLPMPSLGPPSLFTRIATKSGPRTLAFITDGLDIKFADPTHPDHFAWKENSHVRRWSYPHVSSRTGLTVEGLFLTRAAKYHQGMYQEVCERERELREKCGKLGKGFQEEQKRNHRLQAEMDFCSGSMARSRLLDSQVRELCAKVEQDAKVISTLQRSGGRSRNAMKLELASLTTELARCREQRDMLSKRLAVVPWFGDAAKRLQKHAWWVLTTMEHYLGDVEELGKSNAGAVREIEQGEVVDGGGEDRSQSRKSVRFSTEV